MLAARQQIQGSLDTASLLQRSILPGRQLEELFGGEHGLLWLPRDEVGGDSDLVHRDRHLALVGVADCAGHGVSGAMMTMLARAALDRDIQEEGLQSPAALLHRTDAVLRVLLGEADTSRAVAISMDLGLLLIDGDQGRLRFAGARIALHWSDGRRIREQRGAQRSLAEPRPGRWEDHEIPFALDTTYTMSTDGLLDPGGDDGASASAGKVSSAGCWSWPPCRLPGNCLACDSCWRTSGASIPSATTSHSWRCGATIHRGIKGASAPPE